MFLLRQHIVISLGGSLINPGKVDIAFLRKFRDSILSLSKRFRFFIVCGGGKISRDYISAGKSFNLSHSELDRLGIYGTKLNALLLKMIFGNKAVLAQDFAFFKEKRFEQHRKIIIASGYSPGCSSDKVAVDIAVIANAGRIINMSNIDYVYDKNKNNLYNISWDLFFKIVGKKWVPGKNVPFDPVASKKAKSAGKKVIILNGKKLKNFENAVLEKRFSGTTIFNF